MNNLFEMLEKYKFGLLAALLAYVAIFAYFQIGTYNGGGVPYSAFQEGPRLEIPEDEIELLPENIMIPSDFDPSDIKNTVRDANDDRKRSETDYSTNKSTFDGAQAATEYEKNLFKNAAGVEERKRIEKMIQDRQERERQEAADKEKSKNDKTSSSNSNMAAAGIVSVEFDLKNRTAKKLPRPIYMCGVGASGRVVVRIRVDSGGNVISATHDPSRNSGNVVSCMVQTAEDYARKSRFNYSSSAPKSQEGTITYVFVSQ